MSSLSLLDQISAWAVSVMEVLGGPGAGAVIALENLFPPLPSEAVLPLAGFAAARGTMSLAEAIGWTTAGSLAGALTLYGLGRRVGAQRLRALAVRLPLLDGADIDRAQRWFERHGPAAVFVGRLVPLVRSVISVPAGSQGMGVSQFVLLTAAGSLVWNSVLVLSGYLLGDQWHLVERYAGMLSRGVVVFIGVGTVLAAARRLRRRALAPAGAPTDPQPQVPTVDA